MLLREALLSQHPSLELQRAAADEISRLDTAIIKLQDAVRAAQQGHIEDFRSRCIDTVAFHGGSVEIEAAIRDLEADTHTLVAAGHFRRDDSGRWNEVKLDTRNATVLYHAPGWPEWPALPPVMA